MASTSARALNAGSIARLPREMGRLQQVEDEVIEIPFAHALGVRPVEPIERTRERPARDARGLEAGLNGGGKIGPRDRRAAGAGRRAPVRASRTGRPRRSLPVRMPTTSI